MVSSGSLFLRCASEQGFRFFPPGKENADKKMPTGSKKLTVA
jgi:hypothetical protein